VFEFVSPDLGRTGARWRRGDGYDDLVKLLGGPATPAVGFALGMDRVVLASQKINEMSANSVVRPRPSHGCQRRQDGV